MVEKKKFAVAGFAMLALAVILAVVLFGGCKVLPPTNAEIAAAEAVVAATPEGTPEYDVAVAEVARLKKLREEADKNAGGLAALAGMIAPWAGAGLAAAYAAAKRIKEAKYRSMLDATMQAVEEFKKIGGPDAVIALKAELAKAHDAAGIRDAIRVAVKKLQLESV